MCLYTKDKKFRVADHDIVCWKILRTMQTKDGSNVVITPYAYAEVTKDVLSGKENFTPWKHDAKKLDEALQDGQFDNVLTIGEGVIHTYGGVIPAEYMEREMMYFCNRMGKQMSIVLSNFYDKNGEVVRKDDSIIVSVALWKCVIPKGTQYLEGHADSMTSYGAKALRFVEKVAEYKSGLFAKFAREKRVRRKMKKLFAKNVPADQAN